MADRVRLSERDPAGGRPLHVAGLVAVAHLHAPDGRTVHGVFGGVHHGTLRD